MRDIVARISAIFAVLGAVMMMVADLIPQVGHIIFWFGVGILIVSGIVYLTTGSKIREWLWDLFD